MDLSDEELRTVIEYTRRKFVEERYPLDPALEPIRHVLDKLDQKPTSESKPAGPRKRR